MSATTAGLTDGATGAGRDGRFRDDLGDFFFLCCSSRLSLLRLRPVVRPRV